MRSVALLVTDYESLAAFIHTLYNRGDVKPSYKSSMHLCGSLLKTAVYCMKPKAGLVTMPQP